MTVPTAPAEKSGREYRGRRAFRPEYGRFAKRGGGQQRFFRFFSSRHLLLIGIRGIIYFKVKVFVSSGRLGIRENRL